LNFDGNHLYEKYKGILLIVTGVDAHSGLYLLAHAVVGGKSEANWTWFLSCIYHFYTNRASK